MSAWLSRYGFRYTGVLIYMLQASNYNASEYRRWLKRVRDFRKVAYRRKLTMTNKVRSLLFAIRLMMLIVIIAGVFLLHFGLIDSNMYFDVAGVCIIVFYPWLVAYGIIIPLKIGEVLIQKPRERRLISEATRLVSKNSAIKIAIAGSYGKTTFKETLATIIGESKLTAATPGNMNTPLGTSMFVKDLTGKEEVIIFELGESEVGDVAELAEITQPNIGVITGINQAHLETFGSIERTVATIFELRDYLHDTRVYKNRQSSLVAENIPSDDPLAYDDTGVNGWKVSNISVSLEGTRFTATKGKKQLRAESGLLGVHQVGPLVACIDIAERIGMKLGDIEEGVKRTLPFEHRMQPRQLHGAWIIDDTYNGNIQGVEAGLALLDSVKAKRKTYITPGLVEQGSDTEVIHRQIGARIAKSCDRVVLMQNSVTEYIINGLDKAKFKGDVTVIDDPLKFYTSMDQFVASGDVVLMQNDWTDNYV